MCKIGKLFFFIMNLFGSIEDMKKKIFFLWSCRSWNKGKKNEVKFIYLFIFAEEAGDWMGYCPFSSLSHDTMDCIVTQGAGACSRGLRQGQEALRHDPTTRPTWATTWPTLRKGVWQLARARPG